MKMRNKFVALLLCGLAWAFCSGIAAAEEKKKPKTAEELYETLDPFYKQKAVVDGFLIVGSEKLSPYAMKEAAYLLEKILEKRPDVLAQLVERTMYVTIMAYNEMQTDLPECSRMSAWWDKRARGLGGRPVSCGEENLLSFKGDPYQGESIFIHEFAHGMHGAFAKVDEGFDSNLRKLHQAAKDSGRFRGYGMNNHAEFWAEGVQSYFNCNRGGGLEAFDADGKHLCSVNSREQLNEYMPELAKFVADSFRNTDWVYTPVFDRTELPHLNGYNPDKSPTFVWPKHVTEAFNRIEAEKREKRRKEAAKRKQAGPQNPKAGPLFHRAPLLPGEFAMMPLGTVKPRGWLEKQLKGQANSLVGRMDEFYRMLDDNGWLGGDGQAYQWAPYYADGIVPLAYLLDDPELKKKAHKWVSWSLDNPHEDGWIGPPTEQLYRPWGLWYPTPMLKAYVQYYEATGDKRVIPIMTNYLKCLHGRMAGPASGEVELTAGEHDIQVDYFDFDGNRALNVYYSGPDFERKRIPAEALSSLKYNFYEGKWKKSKNLDLLEPDAKTEPWKKMPNLDKQKPAKSGEAKNFDLSVSELKNGFALRFTGKINIPKNGKYSFFLSSDDGSKLSINGKEVVDHDGIHPVLEGGLYPQWASQRWGDYAYIAQWLYDRTGDAFLLDFMKDLKKYGRDWSKELTELPWRTKTKGWNHTCHGVNIGMGIKSPGLIYLLTKDPYDRDAIKKGLDNLDKYHGTAVGIFTADECLAGRNTVAGTELCAVIDEMFSLECLVSALGDNELADRLEIITYNAWPATLDASNWTHQYDQQVNQVVCNSLKRPWTSNGPDSSTFGLDPNFPCCTANMPQGWPKFAANVWMASPDKGLAAVVYAPSEVTATVGDGQSVKVIEETEYPFEGTVKFTVETDKPVEFPLYVRVPAWAGQIKVTTPEGVTTPKGGQYYKVNRKWKNGDSITVELPMDLRVIESDGGYVVYRGPLAYALQMGEDWRKKKDWPDFPNKPAEAADFEVYPTTPWNYALLLDPKNPEKSITVEKGTEGKYVFDSLHPQVILKVKGRRVPDWKLDEFQNAGPVPTSPVKSSEKLEDLKLIPYGSAKLRITVFPILEK